jgi:hypothetical protein
MAAAELISSMEMTEMIHYSQAQLVAIIFMAEMEMITFNVLSKLLIY